MNKLFSGRGGISAKVVGDSKNIFGDRVTTFQLRYHRFVHSEFMTHSMVVRNASSSRAIPAHKQISSVAENPATPIHWGLNQPGMQASKEGNPAIGKLFWKAAAKMMSSIANILWKEGTGFHKQIVNRILEPFCFIDVVATATDWENFFWLRYHKDADPHIAELAKCMYLAREDSTPMLLHNGEWHVPYVDRTRVGMELIYHDERHNRYSLEQAQKISASCCAQVSYRSLDQSWKKAAIMYSRLAGGKPLHASPFAHPCTPHTRGEHSARMKARNLLLEAVKAANPGVEESCTEQICKSVMYCAHFRGFTQYRKLMVGENSDQVFTLAEG